jgi:hypothetical protein
MSHSSISCSINLLTAGKIVTVLFLGEIEIFEYNIKEIVKQYSWSVNYQRWRPNNASITTESLPSQVSKQSANQDLPVLYDSTDFSLDANHKNMLMWNYIFFCFCVYFHNFNRLVLTINNVHGIKNIISW